MQLLLDVARAPADASGDLEGSALPARQPARARPSPSPRAVTFSTACTCRGLAFSLRVNSFRHRRTPEKSTYETPTSRCAPGLRCRVHVQELYAGRRGIARHPWRDKPAGGPDRAPSRNASSARGRGLDPTAAGIRFHVVVRRALDDIAQASISCARRPAGRPAELSASVRCRRSSRWLIPDRCVSDGASGREIEIVADNRIVDLARDGFDLGIRYGEGDGTEQRLAVFVRAVLPRVRLRTGLLPTTNSCAAPPSFTTAGIAVKTLVRLQDLPEELSVVAGFDDGDLWWRPPKRPWIGPRAQRAHSPELDTRRLVAPPPGGCERIGLLPCRSGLDRPSGGSHLRGRPPGHRARA